MAARIVTTSSSNLWTTIRYSADRKSGFCCTNLQIHSGHGHGHGIAGFSVLRSNRSQQLRLRLRRHRCGGAVVVASTSSSSPPNTTFNSSTKLYISGLSFRTTEESLRNAFQNFGQLVEVNLVMDKIANRPRGFAFLRYATEDESKRAIEGMHGKFLDGRVIFVEVAKPRSELRKGLKQNATQY